MQKRIIEEGFPEADLIYDRSTIDRAIDVLAEGMNERYEGKEPVIITVMNGGLIFAGALLPRLDFACRLDYLHATRYRDSTTGHGIEWLAYPQKSVTGEEVILVDDILDEGVTLKAISEYCEQNGAISVDHALLCRKNHERQCMQVQADRIALDVEDRYVFGFGMDYEGRFRHIDGIYALR